MCIAAMSDYDRETLRQMCALEALLSERRRKELLLDAGIRARTNRFMPIAAVEVSTVRTEVVAIGSQFGVAA